MPKPHGSRITPLKNSFTRTLLQTLRSTEISPKYNIDPRFGFDSSFMFYRAKTSAGGIWQLIYFPSGLHSDTAARVDAYPSFAHLLQEYNSRTSILSETPKNITNHLSLDAFTTVLDVVGQVRNILVPLRL